MNHLLCISLNSRGVKDEWAWKPGTELYASHKHSLQIFICVLKHLCMKYRNQGHLQLFLKHVCCANVLAPLGLNPAMTPKPRQARTGEAPAAYLQSRDPRESNPFFVPHNRSPRMGGREQPGRCPSTSLPEGQKASMLCGRLELPTMICQGIRVFGLLHHLFSLHANLEQ